MLSIRDRLYELQPPKSNYLWQIKQLSKTNSI